MNMHTSFLDNSGLHASLDLSAVMAVVTERKGWVASRAATAERHYRMFLELHRRNPGKRFALPADADEVWHVHILMTARYRADCATVLGRFLDHDPLAHISGDDRAESEKQFRDAFGVEVSCDASSS